jgi:hypothetical protein
MSATDHLPEPELERQGKRLARPVSGFFLIAGVLLAPGLLLVILASSWVYALGWVLITLSLPPATVAFGALSSSVVARWAARHKSFA